MSKHSKMYKTVEAIFIQNVTPSKSQLTATKTTIKNKSQPIKSLSGNNNIRPIEKKRSKDKQ